ncbi:MAG TPA: hypothetical protein VMG10_05470 [Gemmataceae bacterium]|nr:hypothetical protein [Gemmataceae bacterium]
MRIRNVVLVLAAAVTMVAVAALSEKKKPDLLLLDWANRGSKERPPAAVLIEMGTKDKQPAKWSGRAVVTGAKVVHREGYRFRPDDKLRDPDRWELSSHWGLRAGNAVVRRMEGIVTVGVVLHLSDIQDDASLSITTAHEGAEKGEVKLKDVLAGHSQDLWGGKARVRLVTTAKPLTSGKTEDDFPAAAYGPDGTLWVAYISYKLRDESRRIEQKDFKEQPSDFKALFKPEFADQLFVKSYKDGKWSEPLAITGPKEDLVRCAIAVEKDRKVSVLYSANRKGKYDVYLRTIDSRQNKLEDEVKITGGLEPQLNPVAATDQQGEMCWDHQKWEPTAASFPKTKKPVALNRPDSTWQLEWHSAVTAGPNGEVAGAHDYYQHGDYDVRVTVQEKRRKDVNNYRIAGSPRFEARPSLCYDAKGRLWIAYEEGPEKWGKDSGALAHGGEPLYSDRSVRVVCLDTDGKLKQPTAELPTSHVGNPGAQTGADVVQRNETATRYAYPRLGLDGRGRLWLSYRVSGGSRYSTHPGSYWRSYARRLDGDHWSEPIEVHHSDGLLDSRPVLLPHASGGLLIVHNTDGRYTTPNDLQNRIYTSYVDLPGEPVEPKLKPHDPGKKDAKAYDKERKDIQRIRDYRIEAGGKKYQLLRGEFHRHTEISWDGGADGSLEDMFRYAIDAAALDWIGNGDHDNGAGREYSWWLVQKFTDAYTIKDRFTPLFCYERSVSYPHGHRNCLFVQRGVLTLPRLAEPDPKKRVAGIHADDTKMLYRYLKEFDGICAVHTSATGMGTDWRDNDPKVEPLVEIYQGDRNSYEKEEAPRAGYDPKSGKKPVSLGGWRPKGYINNALAKGYRLGFESSSDHWSTHISYCVALAEKHDRAGIMAALKQRHSYGATDNIILDVQCGDHLMGDEFKTKEAPVLKVHVIGTAPLLGIDVIKDDEVVEVLRPEQANSSEYKDKWKDPKPQAGVHYYYVRVRQKDGQLAWSSPMWIDYAK